MDWSKIFKDEEDVKKKIRGATGQEEPRKPTDNEGEYQKRLRKANEAKKASEKQDKDFYDKQWSDEEKKKQAKKSALKNLKLYS